MNKTSRAVTQEEFESIINALSTGFQLDKGIRVRRNERVMTALITEINTGLRIGDVLNLHLCDIIYDNGRYRLNIKEQKTEKVRRFTIPQEVYIFLQSYMIRNGIKESDKLFNITTRTVQKYLKYACEYLKIEGVSTHGFRKKYSTDAYYNSGKDVALVSHLLQHSSVAITQKYLNIESEAVENVIKKSVNLPTV